MGKSSRVERSEADGRRMCEAAGGLTGGVRVGEFGSGPGAKEAERGRGRNSQDDIINCMLETAKIPTIITGNMVKTREGTTTAVLLGTADGQFVFCIYSE